MRSTVTFFLSVLLAVTAAAQSLSMGNEIASPMASDYAVSTIRTDIDLVSPANATGNITSVSYYWATAFCMNAVKIKFFRRTGGNLTLIDERGPFTPSAVNNTIAMTPPVAVKQGDLIGIARVANCGNASALIGIVTAGSLSFVGDLTGTVSFDSGARRGEVIAVGATGTATERVVAVLPVVGSTAGSYGSYFRTSLQLANCFSYSSSPTYSGRFILRRQGVPGSWSDPSVPFEVPPNSASTVADIVALFGYVGLGSIDVVVPEGKPLPMMATRVFNDAGGAGTTGLSESAIDPSSVIKPGSGVPSQGATAVMMTPTDPSHTRFNIGVRTLFSGASFTAELRNPNGTLVTKVTKTYAPNNFDQVSAESFFGGASIGANQMIVITVTDGSAIIYGSTTDNVTNDPSVQLAIVAYAIF